MRATPTHVLLPLLALLAATPAAAQVRDAERGVQEVAAKADTTLVRDGDTVILPVLGYTPDTRLLGGATFLRFFYLDPGEDARPCTFSPVVIFTAKKQTLVFVGLDLNWGGGRWHAGIVPSYQRFPDDFYGLGRDAPADPLETYTPEQFAVAAMLERVVLADLRVGVNYRVTSHRLLETEPGGALAGGAVPGTDTSTTGAPGLQLAWDTRDDTWFPRRGLWAQAGSAFFRPGWGSDYVWTEHDVDLRGYVPLGGRGVLAAQVHLVSGDGTVPFYAMPRLGGQDGLRGYSGGRFLDRTLLLARAEWRSGEFWGRLGCVAFAGVGDVAPTVGRLTTAAGLTTFGAGLRVALSREQRVNLRLDMGVGKDDGGFFVSLGEAF